MVVTWRGRDHIGACLDALAAQTRAHRTLVVDNASADGTATLLAGRDVEVLRLASNAGYAGGLAAALPAVYTPLLAWLNDDAIPEPGWLAALEDALDADPHAAAAASRLVNGCGGIQSLGVALTADGHGRDITDVPGHEVFGFCGGAALLRAGALRAAGGVPARFFCYYEDTDTSWRLRLAGYRVVPVPHAAVRHRHGASTGLGSRRFHRWNERNRLLMLLRCAPAAVAAREIARFAAITAMLPVRRLRPRAANFSVPLRLRVLAEVIAAAPRALRARRRLPVAVSRRAVWHAWAGEAEPGSSHATMRPVSSSPHASGKV